MIRLTDEEITAMSPEHEGDYVVGVYYYYNDGIRDGAKAQFKKVVEELKRDLEVTHHGFGISISMPYVRWQALLEEVK